MSQPSRPGLAHHLELGKFGEDILWNVTDQDVGHGFHLPGEIPHDLTCQSGRL